MPFEIILEERDRLKLEVEALKAELVRRDKAGEFAVGPYGSGKTVFGAVSVPLNLFAYYDHHQRYEVLCTESILRRIADRVNQNTWGVLSASMKAATIEHAIYCELEVRHPDDTVTMRELAQLRIRACRRLMSERDLGEIGLHFRMGEY